MKQKLIAVILSVVLTVALTACGKTTKDPEKKPQKYGVREYYYNTDTDVRYLGAEYENLGTERTLIQYSGEEEKVDSIDKWYYDSTGEHLLKHVHWTEPYLSEIEEYDMNGRLIRQSSKKEGNQNETQDLCFPSEYKTYSKKENKNVGLAQFLILRAKPELQEIVTEYTYFGETDTIKEIKTVADTGEVIGLLKRGEGDIILSALINGEYIQYEENYNSETGRSEFRFEGRASAGQGAREYDASGRYTHILQNEEGSTVEIFYEYDTEGGYKTTLESRTEEGTNGTDIVEWYDAEGKFLRRESEDNNHYVTEQECSYYENGEPSRYLETRRYGASGEKTKLYEREYFESGELRLERTYGRTGEPISEKTYAFTEMPGVAGQVLYEKDIDEFGVVTEKYYVFMPGIQEPTQTEKVIFQAVITDSEGKAVYDQQGQFDSEGRLVRIERQWTGQIDIIEFDENGRRIKDFTRYRGNTAYEIDRGRMWEYWEGEDPLAAKS